VTAGEFWRLVLLLIETLFFSLALGMLVSAGSRDETATWLGSVGVILFLAIVPPVLRVIPFVSLPFLDWLSPSIGFVSLREAAYKAQASAFWKAVAGTGMLSFGFLALASWLLPRAWQDRPGGTFIAQRDILPQATRALHAADKRILNQNPVVWLTSRKQNRQQVYLWLIVGVCGTLAVLTSLATMGWGGIGFALVAAAVVIHYVLAVFVAFNACYTLSAAKNSGALELLFSTPLKATDIVDGFLTGLKRQFFWPVITLLWVEAAVVISRVLHMIIVEEGTGIEGNVLLLVAAAFMVMFVMDLYAVAVFGMWTALHAKKPSQAFTKTVVWVLVLPTIVGICCVALPIVGILKNMIFLSYRQALYEKFRKMVSEPHPAIESAGIFKPTQAAAKLPSVLEN
jgi:hypothetical protein